MDNTVITNELRVGNYLQSKGKTIQVENIIYNNYDVDVPLETVNDYLTSKLNRIPISEEELIKFGFKKVYSGFLKKMTNHIEVICSKKNTDGNWDFWLQSDYDDNFIFDHIQFVDTLQNWWYFNSNEELEYEED